MSDKRDALALLLLAFLTGVLFGGLIYYFTEQMLGVSP
jgi:hypothetical protein